MLVTGSTIGDEHPLAVARAAVSAQGCDVALVGFDGNPRACGDIAWLASLLPTLRPHCLWLPLEGDPVMLASRKADVAHLRDTAGVFRFVVAAEPEWPAVLRGLLRSIEPIRIGRSGPLTADLLRLLDQDEPRTDLTEGFRRARTEKSSERITALTALGQLLNDAWGELRPHVRVGSTPRQIVARAEAALAVRGAVHSLIYVSRGPYFSSPPTDEPLIAGDTISVYLEAGDRFGHWLEAVVPVTVSAVTGAGRPVDDELALVAFAAERAAVAELAAGNGPDAAESAAADAAGGFAASLTWSHSILHGVGVGDQELVPERYTPGVAVAIHAAVADTSRGACSGGTYLMTPDGLRQLCGSPTRANGAEHG